MEYRTLGSSGAAVSTFALGTMTFGAETDEEGAHEQLDRFVAAGGSLVDTADVYSAGVSEEIVGRWLGKQSDAVRDRVVLATKGRFPMGAEPNDPGPNDAGLSRRHLSRALDASLRRLGVDGVDLYQVHGYDPCDAAGGDARIPRRRGARGEDPLRRAVELHRLAGAARGRHRRAHGGWPRP